MSVVSSLPRPASPPSAPAGFPPSGRARPQPPRKGLAPWGVVAIWAGLLGILVATSAAFGNNLLVLEVSGSSAGFVLALAGAVWLVRRLRPRLNTLRQPARVGGTIMLAVAAMVAWMSFAFGYWLLLIALLPLLAAIWLEVSARRHAREDIKSVAHVPARSVLAADVLAADVLAADVLAADVLAASKRDTAGHAGDGANAEGAWRREPQLNGTR